MVKKIQDGLYGFIWTDYRQNNCNTYLIDAGGRILVDPGHAHLFDNVDRSLATLGIDLKSIDLVIVTHAHPDHMEAAEFFGTPTLRAVSETDLAYLKGLVGERAGILEPDLFLQQGDLDAFGVHLEVISTPGHTPGSISLYWPEKRALFTGDVVFAQGIGRTDLPGGNSRELKESISLLESLSTDYLLPGHGPVVTGPSDVKRNFRQIREMWFPYL